MLQSTGVEKDWVELLPQKELEHFTKLSELHNPELRRGAENIPYVDY